MQIKWFIHHYGVDMSVALEPVPERYPDFNSFFTRQLLDDARPVVAHPDALVCPIDGSVSQIGNIQHGNIFQAKGHSYTLHQLLCEDRQLIDPFVSGKFATLYLSPRDYHRVHMPLGGRLCKTVYLPGRLFAVNQRTVRVVKRVFARNERVIMLFDTSTGPMALIMVGAIFVGSISTAWNGMITPRRNRQTQIWDHQDGEQSRIDVKTGQEIACFNMGSTVILLFGPDSITWSDDLEAGSAVQMGQRIGTVLNKL